ncbi:ATP-dependent RNA helicase HrpA [Parvibium lacunae]|uniref:ATP-dependent RNA helicase HrpA n=1 Tax=Parvibium lacunae TaxID=1888893 RepID=UPI001EFEDFDC|nr:ATP-dependent RNA helicase HrpA [Parvibium lacunae]
MVDESIQTVSGIAVSFPPDLPVSQHWQEIAEAIRTNPVVIVCGETGSGKTTQLPKICLAAGRGVKTPQSQGLIGHTQPRRLAASSTAKRIAQELGSEIGRKVGYKVRFTDKVATETRIKLMTDGILLAETQGDPLLKAYDTLIIDEAHERSLNIDFLLGFLKQLLLKRPDLRVVITSATIDADRFARHFAQGDRPAPVFNVSGRLYPVEVRYQAIQAEAKDKERDWTDALVDAVDELARISTGSGPRDVLVFLPGEREIREAAEVLRKHHPAHTEILPLYARLSAQEQERVFAPHNGRRIVLATNVAETSLTVPGIRYVVDTGLARVKRYNYRNKVEQLQVEAISQAAANQRAGRCGRVASGVCIRLYDEADYKARTAFTDPEILRSSLAAVILRMKALQLGAIEDFPFIEPPNGRAIADGYQLLQELGALDERNVLTPLGTQLVKLPLDPRIGRMILAAREQHCLREMLIIASALSAQDPRERPTEAQEQADQAHAKFADEKSEFISYLKLWAWFHENVAHKKSNRQWQQTCRQHFLSPLRLREWHDVHSQLHTLVAEQGWRLNEADATYEQLHSALLTGLLGNIGCKADDEAHYNGARGIRFYIWPGSRLAKKAGRWTVAAELVDTSRLFARCVARVEPQWIERVASHLIAKQYLNPHWEKQRGQVVASERGTLHGLVLYNNRPVNFGRIQPQEAREIFIKDGLVPGELAPMPAFLQHNRQLIREIEQLEHKARRPDVLVDEALIAAFYDQHLPAEVVSVKTLEKWLKAQPDAAEKLRLSKAELMRHEAAGVTLDVFPKTLTLRGHAYPLTYHFEPGSPRDGVTLTVPLHALNQIDALRAEWLVPGMLKEKVLLLLKSLPQKQRRHCVPLPDYAAGFVERQAIPEQGVGLIEALIADVRAQKQLQLVASDFKLETLPTHMFMNFKVLDEHGRQLDMGRNLAQLRAELGGQAQRRFQEIVKAEGAVALTPSDAETSIQANGQLGVKASATQPARELDESLQTEWQVGELPELLEIKRGGKTLIGFPALVDKGAGVVLEVFDEPEQAQAEHQRGIRRLLLGALKEQVRYLEKNLPNLTQLAMITMQWGQQSLSLEELRAQIIDSALLREGLQTPLPMNEVDFQARVASCKAKLNLLAQEMVRQVGAVLTEYQAVQKKLPQAKPHADAYADMQQQLGALVHKQFLLHTPYAQLSHLPRYLKAIQLRIDKLRNDPARDARLQAELKPLLVNYQRLVQQRKGLLDDAAVQFRWLLEELRVALFAQELRTPMPVSVKRAQKAWEALLR